MRRPYTDPVKARYYLLGHQAYHAGLDFNQPTSDIPNGMPYGVWMTGWTHAWTADGSPDDADRPQPCARCKGPRPSGDRNYCPACLDIVMGFGQPVAPTPIMEPRP